MDTENQIHISSDQLKAIVDESQTLHEKEPNTTQIVKFTKTASRQLHGQEDKYEFEILSYDTITDGCVDG